MQSLTLCLQMQDIKLFVNSPGGSVTAGMGIYDAMQVSLASKHASPSFGLILQSQGAYITPMSHMPGQIFLSPAHKFVGNLLLHAKWTLIRRLLCRKTLQILDG